MEDQNLQNEIKALRELVEKNLQTSEEVLKYSRKINNFVIQERIFAVIKVLIILVPLVIGIIYLPPLIKELIGTYENLLGFDKGLNSVEIPASVDKIPDSLKRYVK